MPTGSHWLFEIKFDGYRVLIRLENGKGTLITRGGHDWTSKLPSLAQAVEALGVGSAWLDGELVVLKPDGTPDFNGLQNAFDTVRTDSIHCILFDVPYFEGYDLRRGAVAKPPGPARAATRGARQRTASFQCSVRRPIRPGSCNRHAPLGWRA